MVEVERSFAKTINGDCFTPMGAMTIIQGSQIMFKGMLANETKIIYTNKCGNISEAAIIGEEAALELLAIL
jgi:hydroxymethylbilane synthase